MYTSHVLTRFCVCVRASSNVKPVLLALLQLTDSFPRHEPQNADLQQQLELVRSKFKQVSNIHCDCFFTGHHWRHSPKNELGEIPAFQWHEPKSCLNFFALCFKTVTKLQ